MSYRENQPPIKIVLHLQEARIGDLDRLESIKKSLIEGKELPEDEKQYLEEASVQLQTAVEHQMMCDWAMDFVQKLQEKEKKKSFTLDKLKKLLEREKKTYDIDQKFVEQASTKLKHAVEHEKKVNWTLDLISQLKQSKIGDTNKLDQISKSLKSGKSVDDKDKQYLMEKERHFKKVVENKTKVVRSIEAIGKLQEVEVKHSKKLKTIRQSVEQGNLISDHEQSYLNARYEKLQRALDEQNKIAWTIRTIDKLRQYGIGDQTKYDSIKQLLEDEIPVPENEINYLKEQHNFLRQILNHTRKLELITRLIDDLQEHEIGNSQRLATIKKSIAERKPIEENEIAYLKDKSKTLDIIMKNSEKELQTDKSQTDGIDYGSILNELNDAIIKSESLQSKVSR